MSNFWGPFFHFFGVKKKFKNFFWKYFSNHIEKLHIMAFIYFFFYNFWKSWKNWNYLHKIFFPMYSICYTRHTVYPHILSSGGKYNFLFKWLINKQKLHLISISECSVTVIQPFGVITSPGFPQTYRHGIDCTWHIQLQIGQLIHISFLHFELRSYFYWWDAKCFYH